MLKRLLFTVLSFFVFCSFAVAVEVMLAWDANDETDLAGYRVYQTDVSGDYTKGEEHAVATAPAGTETATVHVTEDGRYYWVVTAYDEQGNESDLSNEVTEDLDSTSPEAPTGFKVTVTIAVTGN